MSALSNPAQEDVLFTQWSEWIQIILADIQGILLNRHIFREVQGIVAANPNLHQSSAFYDWMTSQYEVSASVGVRRQLDKDKRSISLHRLLTEVSQHPEVLTRTRYVAGFVQLGYSEYVGNRDFDGVAGKGTQRIEPAVVEAELMDFHSLAERIKVYTNKRIAHRDSDDLHDLPTNSDLDACLECMEQLVKQYTVLLRGEGYTDLVPTFLYDWKAIFYHPWLPHQPATEHDEQM